MVHFSFCVYGIGTILYRTEHVLSIVIKMEDVKGVA